MFFRSAGAALLVASLTHSVFAANVWINEIHYDNVGADVDEFVEIAGVMATDLSDWSLVFYNGSDGEPYRSVALSGVLSDHTGSGFGFLDFAAAGMQNGAPDGLALVDDTNGVRQFLSYEGVLTAVSGPAVGFTSTDIGVVESASTRAGLSLQLAGFGNRYADFSWLAGERSPGSINPDQQLSAVPLPGALPLFVSALVSFGAATRLRRRSSMTV